MFIFYIFYTFYTFYLILTFPTENYHIRNVANDVRYDQSYFTVIFGGLSSTVYGN